MVQRTRKGELSKWWQSPTTEIARVGVGMDMSLVFNMFGARKNIQAEISRSQKFGPEMKA